MRMSTFFVVMAVNFIIKIVLSDGIGCFLFSSDTGLIKAAAKAQKRRNDT